MMKCVINEPAVTISVINKLVGLDGTITQPPCEYLGARNPFFGIELGHTCNYR